MHTIKSYLVYESLTKARNLDLYYWIVNVNVTGRTDGGLVQRDADPCFDRRIGPNSLVRSNKLGGVIERWVEIAAWFEIADIYKDRLYLIWTNPHSARLRFTRD
jgi:hypothetical protein